MLRAAQNGRVFPNTVSEQEYLYVRDHKDEDPALTGFVGFGTSFGSGFFRGYGRNNFGRNYADEATRSLQHDMETLRGIAEFTCLDYRDVYLPDGCVVYADPPYNNTTKIHGQQFDIDAFWDYMRIISQSHIVFISELNAPPDFVCVWSKPVRRSLDVNKQNKLIAVEKLFVHENNIKVLKGNW